MNVPATTGAPGFDFDGLIASFKDDPAFLAELIELVEADSARLVGQVVEAAARGEARALERSAHSLRGLLSNLGESPAHALCGRLEALAKAPGPAFDEAAARDLAAKLDAEVAAVRRSLARIVP